VKIWLGNFAAPLLPCNLTLHFIKRILVTFNTSLTSYMPSTPTQTPFLPPSRSLPLQLNKGASITSFYIPATLTRKHLVITPYSKTRPLYEPNPCGRLLPMERLPSVVIQIVPIPSTTFFAATALIISSSLARFEVSVLRVAFASMRKDLLAK